MYRQKHESDAISKPNVLLGTKTSSGWSGSGIRFEQNGCVRSATLDGMLPIICADNKLSCRIRSERNKQDKVKRHDETDDTKLL